MQKWMWNCGIERGLFNPNSFSATREKHHLGGWALVEIHGGWVWKSDSSLYFASSDIQNKGHLIARNSTRFVGTYSFGCELRRTELQEVFIARSDTLFTNFIDSKFSISTRTKQASKTKVNKIKPFSLLSVKEVLWVTLQIAYLMLLYFILYGNENFPIKKIS